jgi:enterobacteria phage integrase
MGASQAESRIRRLKFHHAFRDRHGVLRHYFRRNGKRTTLRSPFGSAEFWADYNTCLAEANATEKPQPRASARDGSFSALAALYFASSAYRGLAKSSRINYRRVIETFLAEHGHGLVKQFKREHAEVIIGDMAEKPGAGIVLLKRIRTLVRFAIDLKWIDTDPTAGIKAYRSKEFHTWTDAELEQFEKHWKPGTKQRLGYCLHLFTGQRGSDICPMAYSDISGDTIAVVQEKTDQALSDEKLVIPMHPALQRELALHKRKQLVIMATDWGKPFTVKGFGNFMSDAIRAAKLPAHCKAHGLRKASARRLAEAGATAKQIQAITGHKTLAEVERYTRKADQVRLAQQAIDKLKKADGEVATSPKMQIVSTRD